MRNFKPKIIEIKRRWPFQTIEYRIDQFYNVTCYTCENKTVECYHAKKAVSDKHILDIFSKNGIVIPEDVINRIKNRVK